MRLSRDQSDMGMRSKNVALGCAYMQSGLDGRSYVKKDR